MLTGENGILNKATTSREKTDMSSIKEQAEIAKEGAKIGNIAQGKQTTRDEIIDSIVNEMGIPKENVQGNLITTKDGQYEIMVKEDNTIEVVKKGQGYIDAEYKEPALESDFRWTTLENGTVRIYEYLGTETSLHIPDTIDEKPVTMLKMDKTNAGDSSGWVEGGQISKSGVVFKSVKIPDTVTEIGANSFDGSELESIKLPSKLTNIGPYSFNKNKLKNIEIPEGVTTIGGGTFFGDNLQKLIIPSTITNVRMLSFSFSNIDYIEFKGNTFPNIFGVLSVDNITEIKVPYSEDHSVLEYYQGLIGSTIDAENIGSITEK